MSAKKVTKKQEKKVVKNEVNEAISHPTVERVESGIINLDHENILAKDVHVGKYVLYFKSADGFLYREAAFTNKATMEQVNEAFIAGCVINDSNVMRVPVFKTDHAAAGSAIAYTELSFIKPNTTTATQADIVVARSTNVA